MKNLFYCCAALLCLTAFVSCDNTAKQQAAAAMSVSDSLKLVVFNQQNELAELVSTLNAASQQLDQINGQIAVSGSDDNLASQRDRLLNQLAAVQQKIADKEKMLSDMQKKYKSVLGENNELKKSISRMKDEISGYQYRIEQYETLISSQTAAIDSLTGDLTDVRENLFQTQAVSDAQAAVIGNQDKMLNTGYYVVAEKSALKEMGLIEGGLFVKKRLTTKGFDTSVFKEVDIRDITEIPLGSKDATILSSAPEGSYELVKGYDKKLTLRILDQEKFWSLSKYLVVMI